MELILIKIDAILIVILVYMLRMGYVFLYLMSQVKCCAGIIIGIHTL